MARQLISVILSFRNEEETIPEMVQRLQAVFSGLDADGEFIFVDDMSNDRSRELLDQHHAQDPRVKILAMARRSGPAECVLAGIAAARGDAVVYLDADLQDPPELIPTLVAKWRAGADVVHTRRTIRHGEPPYRLWLTRRAYEIINWFSRGQMPVESGDYKLLSRRASEQLLGLRECDPYLRGLPVWIGYNQVFVDYERQARGGGTAKYTALHRNSVKSLVAGVTSFSSLPIYATGFAGLGGLALSALLLLIGLFAGGNWLVAAFLLFLWGSLMLAIGSVGLYVARIYKDVRGRPRWIVREGVGIDPRPDIIGLPVARPE